MFNQFRENPEEFILKAAALINDEKATAIIQHITYHVLDDRYDTRCVYRADAEGAAWTPTP